MLEQHDAAVVHAPPPPVHAFVGAPVAPNTVGCLVGLADAGGAGEPHLSLSFPDDGHTLEQHDAAEVHSPPVAMQVGALEGKLVGGGVGLLEGAPVMGAPVVGLCVGLDEIVGLPVVGVAEGTLVGMPVGMPVGLAVGMPVGLADPMRYMLVHDPLATWFHILALTR